MPGTSSRCTPTAARTSSWGSAACSGPTRPCGTAIKQQCIKTPMQALICRAGRLIEPGRRLILGLGANDRAAKAFARLHGELFAASART